MLGGNIIDFDIPFFARSIFHFRSIYYDGIATQLYVDRRGAPEQKQFGLISLPMTEKYNKEILSLPINSQITISEINYVIKKIRIFPTVYLKIKNENPDKKIFLLGESMGGAITLSFVNRFKNLPIDGVILIAPAIWNYFRWFNPRFRELISKLLCTPSPDIYNKILVSNGRSLVINSKKIKIN